jgi:hypothetical protein
MPLELEALVREYSLPSTRSRDRGFGICRMTVEKAVEENQRARDSHVYDLNDSLNRANELFKGGDRGRYISAAR